MSLMVKAMKLKRRFKSKRSPMCMPCEADVNLHSLIHLPFREWCPYCVQLKAVSYPHAKIKAEETDVPVISSDYVGLNHREPQEGQNPIIVTVDRKTKAKFAHVVEDERS